jgi:hypothetical protein
LALTSFVDNDVLLKLTACDLFWEAIALLKVQPSDVKALTSAEFMFRRQKSIKQQYSEEIRNKAITIVQKLSLVETDQSNPFLSLQIKGLDVGELNLIHAAINEPAFYLVTGDKRCLKALAKSPELATARAKLNGKVVCFEQLIYQLIIVQGFESIKQKVLPVRGCDTALKSIFGSGDRAQEANVIDTLGQYIEELKKECPNLLMDFA